MHLGKEWLVNVDCFSMVVGQMSWVGDEVEFVYDGAIRRGRVAVIRYNKWSHATLVTVNMQGQFRNFYCYRMKDFRNITLS